MWESSKIDGYKVWRKIAALSPGSLANFDALFKTCKPSHATANAMLHGWYNILYGSCARFNNQWNSFKKELHNQEAVFAVMLWKSDSCIVMLKPTYMVSRIAFVFAECFSSFAYDF